MVGPLLLLKILHCKRMNRRKERSSSRDYGSQGPSHRSARSVDVKVENSDEDEKATCRVCLQRGNIPIYGSSLHDDISQDLMSFGGIQLEPDDEYPKNLCHSCNSLLQGAILLRKTAQKSDEVLKQQAEIVMSDTENNELMDSDLSMPYEYQVKKVEFVNEREPEKNYHCQQCSIEFDTFEEYSAHRLSPEHENFRVECPVCHNKYTSVYIKRHLSLHKMDAAYMCDICGKKFVIQGHFTRHRMTHFIGDLPFKCSLCPYRGRFTESLKMHMRSHTGEKPYQCPQCPSRAFVNKSNLNKHMFTHRSNHDFKCDQCQRGFYSKRELELHFKVDHSGIKDHVCNVCGKAFGYRKQMMKHQLKVHKREKLRSGRTPLYILAESKKHDEPEQAS